MVGGSAAAATVVALPDCLTPAEKLDHMWSKENSWTTYPSLGAGGPVSLQHVSPGRPPHNAISIFVCSMRNGKDSHEWWLVLPSIDLIEVMSATA